MDNNGLVGDCGRDGCGVIPRLSEVLDGASDAIGFSTGPLSVMDWGVLIELKGELAFIALLIAAIDESIAESMERGWGGWD